MRAHIRTTIRSKVEGGLVTLSLLHQTTSSDSSTTSTRTTQKDTGSVDAANVITADKRDRK